MRFSAVIAFAMTLVAAAAVGATPTPNCNPDATDCSCSGLFCTRDIVDEAVNVI